MYRGASHRPSSAPLLVRLIVLPPFILVVSEKARCFSCIEASQSPSIRLNLTRNRSWRCRFSIAECSLLPFWPPWAAETHCFPLEIRKVSQFSPDFNRRKHGRHINDAIGSFADVILIIHPSLSIKKSIVCLHFSSSPSRYFKKRPRILTRSNLARISPRKTPSSVQW